MLPIIVRDAHTYHPQGPGFSFSEERWRGRRLNVMLRSPRLALSIRQVAQPFAHTRDDRFAAASVRNHCL